MAIEIRYRSTRAEIWRWYWRRWRLGLWRFHLLLLLSLPAYPLGLGLLQGNAPSPGVVALATGFSLLGCLMLVVYPQLAFKSQERWLKIGPDGIDTSIGRRAGHRNWSEMAPIEERADAVCLIVRRTGNAFLVPQRAFATDEERQAFVAAARQWSRPEVARPPSRSV